MPHTFKCTNPTEPFTVEFSGQTWTVDPARLRDNVPQDMIGRFKELCSAGGAKGKGVSGRADMGSHSLIWFSLVLSEAAGWDKALQIKLLDGLIPGTCAIYMTHMEKMYIAPIRHVYGPEFGSIAQWLIAAGASCKGIKPGETDSEGYPVPVTPNNGFAYYIIEAMKLMRRLLKQGTIDEDQMLKWMIETVTVNTYSLFASQTEGNRALAEKIREDRAAVLHLFLIKLGDPLFPGIYRGYANKPTYDLPDVPVDGRISLKAGDKVFVDPVVAYQRMMKITDGVDPKQPTTPKSLAFCGGAPSKAISARYSEDCSLLENTDVDVYFARENTEEKSMAASTRHVASGHRMLEKLLLDKHGGHGVIATIDRRSVITLHLPNNPHPWQIISTNLVSAVEILREFDWSHVQVQWLGGEDFVMTPMAYCAHITGQSEIRTQAGYNPHRVVKTSLGGFRIVKDERITAGNCADVINKPEAFQAIAEKVIYGRLVFESAGPVPTKAEYMRFKTALTSGNRNYVYVGLAGCPGEAPAGEVLNNAVQELRVEAGSFRKAYNDSVAVDVDKFDASKMAPIPAGNADGTLLKKVSGGCVKVAFREASMMSMEQDENGNVIVKIIGDVIEAAIKAIEGHVGGAISARVIDGNGVATLTIRKTLIDSMASKNGTPLTNQHLAPLVIADFLGSRVMGKLCDGKLTFAYTNNPDTGKRYITPYLTNLSITCAYVRSDAPTCQADADRAAAAATAADATPRPVGYVDDEY